MAQQSWKERRFGNQQAGSEGQSFSKRSFNATDEDVGGGETYEFKVVMVGTVGVGKTSLACRYVKDTFREFVNATIGASYMWKKEIINDKTVKFSVWDTAGQEQFHSLVPMYFRETDAVVLVVDVTRDTCVDEASMWLEKVKANAPAHVSVFLALNKIDLDDKRLFSREDAEEFCKQNPCGGIAMLSGDVSARSGFGVQELFTSLGEQCLEQRLEAQSAMEKKKKGVDAVRLASPRRERGSGNKKCKC